MVLSGIDCPSVSFCKAKCQPGVLRGFLVSNNRCASRQTAYSIAAPSATLCPFLSHTSIEGAGFACNGGFSTPVKNEAWKHHLTCPQTTERGKCHEMK